MDAKLYSKDADVSLFFTLFNFYIWRLIGPLFWFNYQDKPEPPPEGRLPDATKGKCSGLAM